MGAEVSVVRFQKLQGHSHPVNEHVVGPRPGVGVMFVGQGSLGTGYDQTPGSEVSQDFPVRGGEASWEVWTSVRFAGADFAVITDVHIYVDSFNATGLGTVPTTDYLIPVDSALIQKSGVYMHKASGPIELAVDPVPLSSWIPASSPSRGLPFTETGWILFTTGPGTKRQPEDATAALPPESLDLTPHNPSIAPVGDELYGRGILVADPEPRYSNVAVLNMTVAADATASEYTPAIFGVEWNES